MDETAMKARLLEENREFHKAFEQHRKLEKKLSELRARSYLTEEEKREETQMKKEKLLLKDKMYRMMSEFRKS